MKKKEPIGFKTPSVQIQEEYSEILEQILAKKANWEKIVSISANGASIAANSFTKFIESVKSEDAKHADFMELEHRAIAMGISVTQMIVARIGKELAECDTRISEVEKELKELRRGLK